MDSTRVDFPRSSYSKVEQKVVGGEEDGWDGAVSRCKSRSPIIAIEISPCSRFSTFGRLSALPNPFLEQPSCTASRTFVTCSPIPSPSPLHHFCFARLTSQLL